MRLPPSRQVRTRAGTDVVAVDWAGAPFTEVRVVLPLARDDDEDAALAAVLARVLPLGPEDVGAAAHDERVLGHGAAVGSQGGVDRVTLSATVPPDRLGWALAELLDRVREPVHDDVAIAEAVRSEQARVALGAGHRETLVHRTLTRLRWGPGHPGARGVLDPADLAPLEGLAPDELATYARRVLTLSDATVMVVGDLGTDDGRRWDAVLPRLVDPVEAAWPRHAGAGTGPTAWPDPGARGVPRVVVPLGGDEPTASVRLWAPAPVRQHPDHAALHQVGMVLGGYFGSRLNQELRERRGDVYGVTCGFEVLARAATFAVMMECPVERLDAVHGTLTGTVADLREHGPSAGELEAAVRYSTHAATVGISSPGALASAGSAVVFGGDTLDVWDRHARAARALTPPAVRDVAARYLASEAVVDLVAAPVSLVGDDVVRADEIG